MTSWKAPRAPLQSRPPSHLDITLQDWLLRGAQHEVGASHVFGSYEPHVNVCEPNLVRHTGFDSSWCGEGFRCMKGWYR